MKRSIYVVDDQVSVMEMTALVLRRLGHNWEVTGFTEPQAVLQAVKARAPAAVLSDQIMPGMLGSELLEEVRLISPTTIRVIMSGCVSLNKLTLITSAHQYIAKPYDPVKLRDLIQRSFEAQERIIDPDLQAVVTSIRSIPSLPQAHHSLLSELEDMQSNGGTIARLIASDPGVSVKVLQLANSALFGHGYEVTELLDAVNCLGTDMIRAIVLSQSVFRHYESLSKEDIDLPRVWAHCWETAVQAQRLCREKKLPRQASEEAFLAGLLHEVGRFVLVDNFRDLYRAAGTKALEARVPLAVSLREFFQAGPSQLSAYVLELWGLPSAVTDSIAILDNPEVDPARGFSMTTALYVAHQLASRTHAADDYAVEDWKVGYLESVGCAEDVAGWENQGTEGRSTGEKCLVSKSE